MSAHRVSSSLDFLRSAPAERAVRQQSTRSISVAAMVLALLAALLNPTVARAAITPVLAAADTVPGTPSTITGSGWLPNDAVTVLLENVFGDPVPGGIVIVTTTAAGAFPPGTLLPVPTGTPFGPATAIATDGQGNTTSDPLLVQVATPLQPLLTNINPNSGPLVGGNNLVLTGTNFTALFGVTVGGIPVPIFSSTASTLTIGVPPGVAPGAVPVQVSGLFGFSGSLPYVYLPPTATATSPVEGGNSTQVVTDGWNALTALSLQLVSPAGDPVGSPVTAGTDINGSVVGATPVPVPAGTPAGAYTVEVTDGITTIVAAFAVTLLPTLSSIDPPVGPTSGGQSVSLTGTGFAPDSEVMVDGAAVPAVDVIVVDSTTISFITPSHPVGSVGVGVVNDSGTTTSVTYTYVDAPTVVGLDPVVGPTAGGEIVTVTGTGFVPGTDVSIDGTPVAASDVSVLSSTELSFISPAHPAGPTAVRITTPGGTSAPLTFTYVNTPTATLLTPNSGPTVGGQLIGITGSGFVAPFTSVIVDGNPVAAADVSIISDTELSYLAPTHSAGPIEVRVTNPSGSSDPLTYTYLVTPTAASLSPPNGPLTGGNTITLTGSGFSGGTTNVSVAGAPVPITVLSSTSLTFVSPVGVVIGSVNVLVANGSEVAFPLPYEYDEPFITADGTYPGTPTTLGGTGWRPSDLVTVELQNGDGNPVSGATDSLLITTAVGAVPAGVTLDVPADVEPGNYLAVATDSQGNTESAVFTVSPIPPGVPTISTINPVDGPLTGVPGVTITGSGFVPGSVVLIDEVPITIQSVTPTTITFDLPVGVQPGQVEIRVSNGPELDSAPLPFNYLPPVAEATSPVIAGAATQVTTAGWQATTGLTLQLVSPLGDPIGAAVPAVTDGSGAVAGSVAVPVPAASPSGVYGVVVSNGVTEFEVPIDVFSVPTASDLDPDSGPIAGGQTVTVTGSGFTGPGYGPGDVEVAVDGIAVPAVDVIVASDTELTYLTPAHSAGVVDIAITTPGGDTASLDYTYVGVPSVESLVPSNGPLTGGTSVSITGAGFVDGVTSALVDGVEVTATFNSPTELSIRTPPGTSTGPVDVVVVNGELLSGPLEFTYDVPDVAATNSVPGGTSKITGGGWRPVDQLTIQLRNAGLPVGSALVVATDENGDIPGDTLLPIPVDAAPGPYTVVVLDSEGNEAETGIAVAAFDGPVVTALTPTNGPLSGGTEVTATGSGFLAGSVVRFDGIEIVPNSISEDGATLVFIVPPGSVAGPVDVQIVSAAQPSNPLTYTYDPSAVDVGGSNVPGGLIPVTGSCWPSGATVTVQLRDPAGNPVGKPVQAVVGSTCAFNVQLPVPLDAAPGQYTVNVSDSLGNAAVAGIRIVQPALRISSPSAVAGVDPNLTTVTGTDWQPNVPVALEVRSDPISLGSQTPGLDGAFTLQFTTTMLPVGVHNVWATQVRTDGVTVSRSVTFEIKAPVKGDAEIELR